MPDDQEAFEQHPDIRDLRGLDRDELPNVAPEVQAKIELFNDSPRIVELNEVPVGATVHIRSLSSSDKEREFAFLREPDEETGKETMPRWTVTRYSKSQEQTVQEPARIMGACASSSGAFLEIGPPSVRKNANLLFSRTYHTTFRDGHELAGSEYEDVGLPEQELAPDILKQYLRDGYVIEGEDGLLRWHLIDHRRSHEFTTGEVQDAYVEYPEVETESPHNREGVLDLAPQKDRIRDAQAAVEAAHADQPVRSHPAGHSPEPDQLGNEAAELAARYDAHQARRAADGPLWSALTRGLRGARKRAGGDQKPR